MIDRFKLLNDWGVSKIALSQNPNLTPKQIDLLYDADFHSQLNLAHWAKLTEEQFMRFFNDEDFDKDYLAQNPNLTTEQIDLLYQTEGVNKEKLARYSKLSEEQFMRLFNDGITDKNYLAMNPSINPVKQPFASGIFNWRW